MDITAKEIIGMGVGASVVGTMWSHLSSLPHFIWNKVRQKIITTVDMPMTDDHEVKELIRALEYWMSLNNKKTNRYFKANLGYNDLNDTYDVILSPDVVNNTGLFTYEGKKMLISANKREASASGRIFFDYTITFFTRDSSISNTFIADIKKQYEFAFRDTVVCKIFQTGRWIDAKRINTRPFDSVILPEGQLQGLIRDIDLFISRKELYEELNINHKRGYLFEGVPGSGKSTLANAIAYYLKWNLYSFSKASAKDATSLNEAFSDIKSGSVILLEDVDGYGINRGADGSESEGITIDWLNWLDGINTPNDVIFVLTTNYVNQLDPALVRDGRVDYNIHFDYANSYQIETAYKRFNVNSTDQGAKEFANQFKDKQVVMADIQNKLFREIVPEWRGLSNE